MTQETFHIGADVAAKHFEGRMKSAESKIATLEEAIVALQEELRRLRDAK